MPGQRSTQAVVDKIRAVTAPPPAAGPSRRQQRAEVRRRQVSERLQRAGLRAYSVDLERVDLGIPALRAFVPGLAHYKPRLGLKRLTDVPRGLHWRDDSFGAQDLSEVPLLI